MSYNDSAVSAHFSLLNTMVHVEKTLSSGLKTSSYNTGPKIDLTLTDDAKDTLHNITTANKYPPGLNLELQIRSSQFLIEQAMYSRELSAERITRSTSSFTSSRTISNYTSYFEREALAFDYYQLSALGLID